MAKVIIGIHGLANKGRRRVLADWWKASIREGLRKNLRVPNPRFRFEMVYWADLLYKNPLHDDKDFSFDALYNDQPYIPAKRGALQRYDDRWYDRVRGDVREHLSRGLEGLKSAIGLDQLADRLLEKKLKDLAFYWSARQMIRDRNGRRRQAGRVLDDECRAPLLAHKDDRIMLIAHSMGSIMSYNVLRHLGRPDKGVRVSHYVTIGAPLGLQIVKERTKRLRWDGKVRTPSIVTERWANLSDRKDPVAFDTHLRDDYGPNALGVRVVDDLVLNDYTSPSGDANHHKSYGYLRTPEMSDLIGSFLRL